MPTIYPATVDIARRGKRKRGERKRENRGIKIDPSVAGTTCNLVMKSIPRSRARARTRGSKSRDMDWGSSRPDVTQCFPLICCSRAVRPCFLVLVRPRR